MPCFQFIFILFPSTGNYVLLRLHSQIGIPTLVAIPILSISSMLIVYIAYPIAASLNSLSKAYLKSFSKGMGLQEKASLTDSTVTKREIRACRDLRIHFGSFLYLRRFTVLKVISIIIYWTLRFMLLF
jgi:hypothetical protein